MRVFEVVERAAAAGHEALVERLLARGERVTKRHPWRAKWEEHAFRARLLLLYKRKDRAGILELPLPSTATGDSPSDRMQRETLEESRQFYVALHDLEDDPASAQAAFAAQLAKEPSSAALLTNLFAAKLRVAGLITDAKERRTAYRDALRWWTEKATVAPSLASDPIALANELIALDGSELDEAFDRRWGQLDDITRGSVDILKVRLENLQRRGMHVERERLRDVAQRRHGADVVGVLGVEPSTPVSTLDRQPSIDDYQRYWAQIRVLHATEMSSVFSYPSLQDYLLRLHVNACEHLLRRFETILAVGGDEDRANDIVVTLVGMQIAGHDWTAQDFDFAKNGSAARDKVARYLAKVRPALKRAMIARGRTRFVGGHIGIASVLSWTAAPSTHAFTTAERIAIRALGRVSHAWSGDRDELAQALGVPPSGYFVGGRAEAEAKRTLTGPRDKQVRLEPSRLLDELTKLLRIADVKAVSSESPVERVLFAHKLSLEVVAEDVREQLESNDELQLQRSLCRFFYERDIRAFGTKIGRSELDARAEDGFSSLLIEAKKVTEPPSSATINKWITQLGSYMDQEKRAARGALVLYNFTSIPIFAPKETLLYRYLLVAINLCPDSPSRRTTRIEISEGDANNPLRVIRIGTAGHGPPKAGRKATAKRPARKGRR